MAEEAVKPPNMFDVAARAHVSQRTVSNVLSGTVRVSPGTRERVERAIRELGYKPNLAARSLRQGRTDTIGVVMPLLQWPYYAELAHLIRSEADALGYRMLVLETGADEAAERRILRELNASLVDGVILSALAISGDDLMRLGIDLPIVLLGERLSGLDMLHLSIDNAQAAADVAGHLHDQGARSFWVVGSSATAITASAGGRRLTGFVGELRRRGVPESGWSQYEVSPWTLAGGYTAVRPVLEVARDAGRLPDAIYCMNDLVALGVMRACWELGVRVPGDLLLTGWDDTAVTSYTAPPLTVISPDKEGIARGAVRGLVSLVRGEGVERTERTVGHRLIVRGSTQRQRR